MGWADKLTPTILSSWVDIATIDKVGFQPNVLIPATEPDWINCVVRYHGPNHNAPSR